jgi:hypothetical protein
LLKMSLHRIVYPAWNDIISLDLLHTTQEKK